MRRREFCKVLVGGSLFVALPVKSLKQTLRQIFPTVQSEAILARCRTRFRAVSSLPLSCGPSMQLREGSL